MYKQRPPPDARITKMREMEDRLAKMSAATKEDKYFSAVAKWEVKTSEKIKNNVVAQRFEALKARREADLNIRRAKLAELLEADDLALKQELLSNRETPEQRRAKLAARARQLAERHEAERQELAQTLYDQAFQENCDVLRDANSKRILYRTLEERDAQIEQKMMINIMAEEEKRIWYEMNEAERQKAEERYVTDRSRDKERRDATVKILDEQVRAVHNRRADEAAAHDEEVRQLHALWQAMAAEQEAADAADREKMKKLAAELSEFNRLKRMEISEAERVEKEMDLRILQEALATEAADEAAETAERERARDEVRRYRQQLALMMQKDAEETAERDAMIYRAQLEQEAKRDAELAARDAARRKLMAEVDELRQAQIRDKQQRKMRDRDELAYERLQFAEEEALRALEDADKKAAQRKAALTQRLEIQTQMVAKAHIRAAEEDEKLRATELSKMAETAYMGRVGATLQATEPPKWYGRRKFDW